MSRKSSRKRVAIHVISSSSDSDIEEVKILPPPAKRARVSYPKSTGASAGASKSSAPKSSAPKSSGKTKGKGKQPQRKNTGKRKGKASTSDTSKKDLEANQNMTTVATSQKVPATSSREDEDTHCVICMSDIENKKTLHLCQHSFCKECIEQWFEKTNPICPSCGVIYGLVTGTQPLSGEMLQHLYPDIHLPGYESYGSIVIEYNFPDGVQTAEHPNPGQYYSGTSRIAYLPNNPEGNKVLRLLKVAFERRLVFTVGRSVTSGRDNTVVWNDIHHKTSTHGGQQGFGYPDPTYLNRVQQELASKGVTE